MEELGDAGWARERERMAHLQQLQQLHQMQLQQQQVGYPGYVVVPPGQPQGPVMVPSPGDPFPAPGMPVHGGMIVPVGGLVPPQVHVPAPWPVQCENQGHIRQDNGYQPCWEYDDRHKAAFIEKSHQRQDAYFHPGSEDGHLDVRISEWKGKHCFYQGPEDHSQQDYNAVPQEKDANCFRTQEEYIKLDKDRRRYNHVNENDWNSEQELNRNSDHRSYRDLEEYESKDRYRHRDHYDRKYNEHYEKSSWKHKKSDLRERDSYNSEYEDYYDHKDTYGRSDKYKDSGHYYDHDRDYYDSRESPRYREKEHYKRREEDRYYDDFDEQQYKDHYYDRHSEERYGHRENNSKDWDVYNKSSKETYASKRKGQYDCGYKERDHCNRYKDTGDTRRDEDYDHRRRNLCKARERCEWRPVDHYEHDHQNAHKTRKGEHSHYGSRERYRDLRSLSDDSSYEEYPKKDRKTHCEEWVEQQNQKLSLGQMHSSEDPVVNCHSEKQENGYESSADSTRSKRGRRPVYVGSLDRNSFYRKTAPSSLQKSQFATARKQDKGKHQDMSCEGMYSRDQ